MLRHAAFRDVADRPDALWHAATVAAVARGLAAASGRPQVRTHIDREAMRRTAELLRAQAAAGLAFATLEVASGLDRWTLFRQVRAVYGVSPYRYLTLRRLDLARRHIATGTSLAGAAAGFAGQSHMTRRFRAAYGISPGSWRALMRIGAAESRLGDDK